ncbi:AAA family ATPase [Candidatus Pacearchaeota archaeon]|nr:AAA family ATPase [Candidatus Pacearchaeota archaeon]
MEEKEVKDKTKIKIQDILRANPDGLTIKEIMDKTGLARHTVLARLHRLTGEDKVGVRQINMAKLHRWKHENEPLKEEKPDDVKVAPIKEEHIKPIVKEVEPVVKKKIEVENRKKIDIATIKKEIDEELKGGKINKKQAQLKTQREPIKQSVSGTETEKKIVKKPGKEYVVTGITGLDELLEEGIPKGATVLVAGGAGSGKTIFGLQTFAHHCAKGKKCLYMSFEESEKRLIEHMDDFGWDASKFIAEGNLKIQRFNPFDITRNVDALLAKQKGELLIEIDPVIFPKDFDPDFIVVDSLTAIASAFIGKEESYRIYVEQLFRFFEKIGSTAFLVTETEQIPKIFSRTGVEEFLADGVIVLYNIKHGNIRENAIEILKLRGAGHQKKIVAMQITRKGIVVYPEQEVFSEIESEE